MGGEREGESFQSKSSHDLSGQVARFRVQKTRSGWEWRVGKKGRHMKGQDGTRLRIVAARVSSIPRYFTFTTSTPDLSFPTHLFLLLGPCCHPTRDWGSGVLIASPHSVSPTPTSLSWSRLHPSSDQCPLPDFPIQERSDLLSFCVFL